MIIHYNERLDAKIRVFISSTFRDMQNERNAMVGGVFPMLRRRYKNQCVDITEVDLRWGITERDIDKLALLEICISETLSCVPFFVGLIGDNYGTLAKTEEIKKLPPAYKRAIGMKSREDLPEGVSLTELEMRAGVFTRQNKDFARFFIRTAKETPQGELARLKNLIIDEGYSYSTYDSTEDFEKKAYESLLSLIDSSLPKEPPPPYGDRHYLSHLRLLKKASSTYVANDAFIDFVEKGIDESCCVYIHGGKGSGKSATMSYLIANEGVQRDGEVFFHFADADEESHTADNCIHRLRLYLECVTGIRSNESGDYNACLEVVREATLDSRIVLFFDATEKYGDPSLLSRLYALCKINPKICVVCSGTALYKSIPARQIEIAELVDEQIRQMTVKALRNCGKKLDEGHMSRIFANNCCRNPLFLTAMLGQLIAYGNHESFEEFFDRLVYLSGFDELFYLTVERLLAHFLGKGLDDNKVYLALGLMAYSNMGVRESELSEIVGMLPVERSIFLASIEIFITEIDTLIRFNHDLILGAARELLVSKMPQCESYVRERLVSYFEHNERRDGDRAYSELPFQYARLGLLGKLSEVLCSVECFRYLAKNQYNGLVRYLISLVEHADELGAVLIPEVKPADASLVADIFCQAGHYLCAIDTVRCSVGATVGSLTDETAPDLIADALVASALQPKHKVRLFATLARSYYKLATSKYKLAVCAYIRAIDFYRCTYPDDTVGLAAQSYLLGVTYKSMAELNRADELLRFSATEYERCGVKNDVSSWIYSVFGNLRFAMGEVSEAKNYLKRAVSDNEFLFGQDSSELAWSYSYAWAVYYTSGEKKTAYQYTKDAYRIYSALYQGRGAKVAWAASNLGACAHMSGSFDEARALYELSIRENNAPVPETARPHPYTLTAYANLALLEYEKRNRGEAIRLIELARDASERKNGVGHLYTANMLLNEGIIKCEPGKVKAALDIYRAHGTPDKYFAWNCYARVLLANDEDEAAEREIDALYEEYSARKSDLDIVTFLINESLEKISFNADTEQTRLVKAELVRFDDYRYYVTLNNSSALVLIPEV